MIAGALKFAYNIAAEAVGLILQGLGYAIDVLADALATAYNIGAQAVAQILKNLGYAVDAIIDVLEDVFGVVGDAIGDILEAIGYGLDVICDFIPFFPPCFFLVVTPANSVTSSAAVDRRALPFVRARPVPLAA